MLAIVAHHYVVNSGLEAPLAEKAVLSGTDYFLLLFGWGGKTGINCFMMITGYFMCTSDIKGKKFFRLLGEWYFYRVVIWCIFFFCGYESFSMKGFLRLLFPFTDVSHNFVCCFLLFYLLIPFLNKLIHALTEREHLLLMAWCVGVYVILPSFAKARVLFNYTTWFSVIYIIASYIRLYPKRWFDNRKLTGALAAGTLLLSWLSVVLITAIYAGRIHGADTWLAYFFVSDSNKILAVATAVCAFLFFKNLNMGYSKVINTIAASTFGVLLIHSNSDAMRRWLWRDVCDNVGVYEAGNGVILHAVVCVLVIYVSCTIIDMARRFIGRMLFQRMIPKKNP